MGWGFAALLSGFGCRECVGCYDGPASTDPAVGSGRGEAGEGAFANHVTFKFSEGSHHGEEEFPFSGGPVGSEECAGEDLEGDVFVVEVVGDGEDFFDGSVEAVQFSSDAESVVGSEVVERGYKAGPAGCTAGDGVGEDPPAADGFECVLLHRGVLAVGGNASVVDGAAGLEMYPRYLFRFVSWPQVGVEERLGRDETIGEADLHHSDRGGITSSARRADRKMGNPVRGNRQIVGIGVGRVHPVPSLRFRDP